jgi:hypothetical protein
MKTTALQSRRQRRGALLLLVLSMLTLFLMIGTLMLVLATRARTTARAFADATTGAGLEQLQAREMLEEALLVLIRGQADGGEPGTVSESLLADRYGDQGQNCTLAGVTGQGSPVLQATVNGINGTDLIGRVISFHPEPNDPAKPAGYRIVDAQGNTLSLANLRSNVPSLLPMQACPAVINGRDFSGQGGNEPYDAFDAENEFLAKLSMPEGGGSVVLQRPSFAAAAGGAADVAVDNDGDGVADGIWLDKVLPARPAPEGGEYRFRVSYLVIDLDGKLNVNAHGVEGGGRPGPADVEASEVIPQMVWDRVLDGSPPGQYRAGTATQRRPPPVIGGQVPGRFGGAAGRTPYGLRLDFEGPRGRGRASNDGDLYTYGELERILRQFDADATTLPPRLAAALDDSAQAVRLLITTDSWDTPGLTGPLAGRILATPAADLPPEVAMGLRLPVDRALEADEDKQEVFENLYKVVVATGAASGSEAAQWVANVIDFCDADTNPGSYQIPGAAGGGITGAEPEPAAAGQLGGWNRGTIRSPADLLGVPKDTPEELERTLREGEIGTLSSLAVEHPEILDAVTMSSPFVSSVMVGNNRCHWREPGRVNVNTCSDQVWEALVGEDLANPFDGQPARRDSDMLLAVRPDFGNLGDFAQNQARSERLAASGTPRSNVFAVWITLEVTNSLAPEDEPRLARLFAIVDRSVPVGYLRPGEDLNARDTIAVLRHME